MEKFVKLNFHKKQRNQRVKFVKSHTASLDAADKENEIIESKKKLWISAYVFSISVTQPVVSICLTHIDLNYWVTVFH